MVRDTITSHIPVIILHGWAPQLSGKTFSPLKAALEKKGYTVFTPDLPGFGENKPLVKSLTLDDYVAYLTDFFKRHKISRGIIIGHSFGGRIGIKFSYLHPDSVRSLILSGTPGFRSGNGPKYYISLGLAKAGKVIIQLFPFGYFYHSLRNMFYRLIGIKDYMRSDPVMRDTFRAVVSDKPSQYMKNLTVPVLLLWGNDDIMVPLSVAYEMKKTIPGAILEIIPDATHAVPYKNSETFASHVDEYIRRGMQ